MQFKDSSLTAEIQSETKEAYARLVSAHQKAVDKAKRIRAAVSEKIKEIGVKPNSEYNRFRVLQTLPRELSTVKKLMKMGKVDYVEAKYLVPALPMEIILETLTSDLEAIAVRLDSAYKAIFREIDAIKKRREKPEIVKLCAAMVTLERATATDLAFKEYIDPELSVQAQPRANLKSIELTFKKDTWKLIDKYSNKFSMTLEELIEEIATAKRRDILLKKYRQMFGYDKFKNGKEIHETWKHDFLCRLLDAPDVLQKPIRAVKESNKSGDSTSSKTSKEEELPSKACIYPQSKIDEINAKLLAEQAADNRQMTVDALLRSILEPSQKESKIKNTGLIR